MRMKDGRRIFRVELSAHIPTKGRNLNDLHQITLRIDTYALHAMPLEFFQISIVELITVTVPLLDQGLAVDASGLAAVP